MGALITNNDFAVSGSTLPTPRAIHYIADSATGITGITTCYDYGSNVLDVPEAHLPALMLAPGGLQPERTGVGEFWKGRRIIEGVLLVKLYDDKAPTIYLPFLEPGAMLYGDRFHQWFNTTSAAHTRRQGLCSNIGCSDLVIPELVYELIQWGSRGYLGWSIKWWVDWNGYTE